jgi:3-deoxy-D-manno-octulosonate 8-phosphate phosphatase (KDO 8-P phosphatase)
MQDVLQRASAVRLLVLDADGVLTDGRLHFGADGEAFKSFHTLDGHGVKMLIESGVVVAILSGRRSKAVERRAADLGIGEVVQGVQDKRAELEAMLARLGLTASQCAFMGDDLPDLPAMTRCALAATVPGAPDAVKARSHYVTQRGGGDGAVRELCELIMRAQGTLEAALARYFA